MRITSPNSFANVREFLAEALKERQQKNPRFSLRAWSKQLGFKNPSLLSDVLSGRRYPSADLVRRIAANLNLNERDESNLQNLCKTVVDGGKPSSVKPEIPGGPAVGEKELRILALDKFRLISDWYHLVILELFLLRGFQCDAKQIAARLARKIPRTFVDTAVARLHRLGLLEKTPGGSYTRTDLATGLLIGKGVSNVAIRNHHQQMIELAAAALDKQDISKRDFSGSTVAIRRADLAKVKDAVYRLHALFNDLSANPGEGEMVYRLNVQLFRVDKQQGEGAL